MHAAVAAIAAVALTLGLPATAQLSRDAAIARAEAALRNLQDARAADIVKDFDAAMTKALPVAKLDAAWPSLVTKFGELKEVIERREGRVEGRQAVELILAFERETIVMRTVFDNQGKIAGLVFRPLNLAVLPASK